MIERFQYPARAMEFARHNSLICYYDPGEFSPFIAADDDRAQEVAVNHRWLLLYEPCQAGGLHTWVPAPRPDGTLSPNYWCEECHEDPPSVAIVGVQGFSN